MRWIRTVAYLAIVQAILISPALAADHSPDDAATDLQILELYQQGRYKEAIPLAEASLARREKALGSEHPSVGKSLDDLGMLYQAIGQYAQALPLQQRGLAIREKALGPDHPDVAESLNNLASLNWYMGQNAEALPRFERSLQIFEKALGPEHPEVARSLSNLATFYRWDGRYSEALPRYQRSLAIREKALGPDHPDVAESLNNLGELYRTTGRYAEALSHYQRSLAIREKALGPVHPDVAMSLNNLGTLYREIGQYAEALPRYQRSLSIREQALGADHPDVASSLNNLAGLYRTMGQYAEALPNFQRSLAIREKKLGPEHRGVAVGLSNLAALYQLMGKYAEALPLYQRSLAIAEKALGPEHPDVATALGNIASLYVLMGQYAESMPRFERSLAIREKALGVEHPEVATSLDSIAWLYRAMGQPAEALPLCRRGLAIREKTLGPEHPAVATSLSNLASIYLAMGRNTEALTYYRRSLAIREKALGPEHPDVAASLNNLALLYLATGQNSEALSHAQRAERIAAAAGAPEILWRAQAYLGRVHARQDERALGIFWGKQAINSLQELRASLRTLDRELQHSFLRDKRSVYTDLADLLIEEGRIAEAQRVTAMLKEDEFSDFVQRDGAVETRSTQMPLTGVERVAHEHFYAVREKLAALTAEQSDLQRKGKFGVLDSAARQRLDTIELDLVTARIAFDAFLGGLANLLATESGARRTDALVEQIESHQNLLADIGASAMGAAAVQYIVSERRLHIVVSTDGGQSAREVALPQAELYRKIAAFRQAVQDRRSDPRPAGRELYALLIAPIAKDLADQGIHTLMLYLDGALRYLPFAALVDGDAYLVERYRLAIYTEAARSRLSAERQPRWQVAAMGVTRAFPEQHFPALPAVRDELAAIVNPQMLPGVTKLDDEFTLPALRASLNNPVVHIASHFRFVPGSDASFLLLGDGSQLTLRQVRTELPRFVNVDLLTLSACDTAVGGGHNEDGLEVEGLGVLAQKQGAKAVLATLWPVADASTGEFMQQFYRGARRTDQSKAEALRQAQLALLRGPENDSAAGVPDRAGRFAHPYFWAPFILMGNWL